MHDTLTLVTNSTAGRLCWNARAITLAHWLPFLFIINLIPRNIPYQYIVCVDDYLHLCLHAACVELLTASIS